MPRPDIWILRSSVEPAQQSQITWCEDDSKEMRASSNGQEEGPLQASVADKIETSSHSSSSICQDSLL